MASNIDKYKEDLEKLIIKGEHLLQSMILRVDKQNLMDQLTAQLKDKQKVTEYIRRIPNFDDEYQQWYSEAQAVIKLLLPHRLNDFIKFYEKEKNRKEIKYGNYVIEDFLQNLTVTRGDAIKVGPSAALPQYIQQLNILKSVQARFTSSLFDIKQLLQADLFDSEIEAAKELNKNKFSRAAGAIAGVVLERHLMQICSNHKISLPKKYPTINDFNTALKNENVVDTSQWRFIQHLADIRNNCDHSKHEDPSKEEIEDMIKGVEKITKTIY